MSFQGSHGGKRANSGRKRKNQTWGGVQQNNSLENFFSTSRTPRSTHTLATASSRQSSNPSSSTESRVQNSTARARVTNNQGQESQVSQSQTSQSSTRLGGNTISTSRNSSATSTSRSRSRSIPRGTSTRRGSQGSQVSQSQTSQSSTRLEGNTISTSRNSSATSTSRSRSRSIPRGTSARRGSQESQVSQSKTSQSSTRLGGNTISTSRNSSATSTSRSRSRSIPQGTSAGRGSQRSQVSQSQTNDTPNANDDPLFDDSVSDRGKKIGRSQNLQEQRKKIVDVTKYPALYKRIEETGSLWTYPPEIVKRPKFPLKERWKDFFQLRVFNWIPEAMIGNNWRPACPNCNKRLTRNGRSCLPRLVFDQNDNYWLHAPDKYECKTCEGLYQQLPKGHPEKKNYSFRSTHDDIMLQIKASYPEIYSLFPCHLTARNAIDIKLMNTITHNAVKGIGPSAMRESIVSWHELEWQKKENRWAKRVLTELHQPTLSQPTVNRNEIEKCPDYFSTKLGGCVPSSKWLVETFCLIVSRNRHYYESECIKRAVTSMILAIDASYKVPKWMMTWGGKWRIYDTLHSGTNEYNEIIMQRFSTSDNHAELRSNLEALRDFGLDLYLCFSDDPGRDEGLLQDIFPRLKDDNVTTEEQDQENLPEVKTNKDCLYLYKYQEALDALSRLREDLEKAIQNTAHPKVKLALDTEWPVFSEGPQDNRRVTHGKVNIVQLGSNVVQYTLILELYNFTSNRTHMHAIGQKLRALFLLDIDCITGCKHETDYKKLQEQYPTFNLPSSALKKFEDVSTMAVDRGITIRGKNKTSLQALCRGQGMYLKKPQHVRVGVVFNSRRGQLSSDALTYCQLDVEAPLLLHQLYSDKPDLTERLTNVPTQVGMLVDIMASASSKDAIAQGIIKQVGPTIWSSNNFKISKKQVLVEVKRVFNARGVIHYPCDANTRTKCACKRESHGTVQENCNFYMYGQFGKPSFHVVELKSRLRKSHDQIEYPDCIYKESDDGSPTEQANFITMPQEGASDTINEVDDIEEDEEMEASDLTIDRNVLEALDVDGDDYDSEERDPESTPTAREVEIATAVEFDKILEDIIAEADRLSGMNDVDESHAPHDDDLPVDELKPGSMYRKVLGDAFHFMDRAKLPMHHEYKALFFRALRAAMFVMHKDDVDKVKEVLQSKPDTSWEKKMAFDFGYIARRVRRRAPSPLLLYNRLKAVFDFFKDKIDSKTQKVLFHETNRKKFLNMLDMVKKGYASDPEGMAMYIPKTDNFGRPVIDKDGLVLYRSLRGTSNLESVHQYLTTSFGHTISGPWYSDSLLTTVRHFLNWRMSRKNRPNFPNLTHYDGLLIDRINALYELLYGEPKYKEWTSFNESLPTVSAYGIVPVNKEHTLCLNPSDEDMELVAKNGMLQYLADRQNVPLPFLPIRGENEKRLIHRKLNQLAASQQSLSNHSTFEDLCNDWNKNEVNISQKIYPKMPCHFQKYVKDWRLNQDRRDAAIASGANRLCEALEHVPESLNVTNFEPVSLNLNPEPQIQNDSTDQLGANSSPVTETIVENTPGMELLCQVCETQPSVSVEQPEQLPRKKQKTKTCQGPLGKGNCPNPTTCDGRVNRQNCELKTGGDPSKKVKRKITKKSVRRCGVCKKPGCKGLGGHKHCPNKPGVDKA